jgi:type I restriction enzyme S subunit
MTEQAEGLLGSSGRIPEDDRYLHNQRLGLLQNLNGVDKRFLYYLFNSQSVRQQIRGSCSGVKVRHTSPSRIYEVRVDLPDLTTQRKIMSVLSTYDDMIENNSRRIKILEEMAQTVYREWFVKFRFPGYKKVKVVDSPLGKIPEGWEVSSFTDVCDVLSGGTPKTSTPEYWGGDIPFFAPKDAPDQFYVVKTEKAITKKGLMKCNSALYPKETVFITARGTVGKVVFAGGEMAMNQSCYALVGKKGISQLFLFFHTLQSVNQLRKCTGGATFQTIIVDTFRRLMTLSPPSTLVEAFTQMARPALNLMLTLTLKNEILRQTRDLLLPRLISGDLDVSDLDIVIPEADP